MAIYGLEVETVVAHEEANGKMLPAEERVTYLDKILTRLSAHPIDHLVIPSEGLQQVRRREQFTNNGSRIYVDCKGCLELATAEGRTAREVVLCDQGNRLTLEQTAAAATLLMNEEGIPGELVPVANNQDIQDHTYGCHENYLMLREGLGMDSKDFFSYVIHHLVPFLVARQVFTGAGKIQRAGRIHYQLSQRPDFIDKIENTSATSSRGFVKSNDEPLADQDAYRRLQLVVGDTNMSEYAEWLKLSLTGAVLELILSGNMDVDLSLDNPVQALKDISSDPSLTTRVPLNNGCKLTALDMMEEYLLQLQAHLSLFKPNSEHRQAIEEGQRLSKGLRNDETWTYRVVDWRIKQRMIYRYLDKQEVPYTILESHNELIDAIHQEDLMRDFIGWSGKHGKRPLSDLIQAPRLQPRRYKPLRKHLHASGLSTMEELHRVLCAYNSSIQRDLRYHEQRRGLGGTRKGLYYTLCEGGFVDWNRATGITLDEILTAQHRPIQTTRARIRGNIVQWLTEHSIKGEAKWESIVINGVTFPLPNPYQSSNRKISKRIRYPKK